jgi:hypothetical protein
MVCEVPAVATQGTVLARSSAGVDGRACRRAQISQVCDHRERSPHAPAIAPNGGTEYYSGLTFHARRWSPLTCADQPRRACRLCPLCMVLGFQPSGGRQAVKRGPADDRGGSDSERQKTSARSQQVVGLPPQASLANRIGWQNLQLWSHPVTTAPAGPRDRRCVCRELDLASSRCLSMGRPNPPSAAEFVA